MGFEPTTLRDHKSTFLLEFKFTWYVYFPGGKQSVGFQRLSELTWRLV